jgi:pimeloyl-ACP methyl ester carboxylesterase
LISPSHLQRRLSIEARTRPTTMTLFIRTVTLEAAFSLRMPPPIQVRGYQPAVIDRKQAIIVFLPFWGGSAETNDNVQDRLAISHPMVPSFSLSYPGTGFQPQTASKGGPAEHLENDADAPEDHDIPALAECVLKLLDWIREIFEVAQKTDRQRHLKVVLCAHSMSAKVNWEVLHALSKEDNPRTSITGLLLLAPAPIEPLVLPPETARQQLIAYDNLESATWTIRHILTSSPLAEDVVDKLAQDCVAISPAARRGWIELGMKYDCTDTVQSLARTLNASEVQRQLPIKILVGEHDRVETPEKVRTQTVEVLQQLGLLARMKVVPDVGHLLPVEATNEVVAALREML